MDSLNSDKKQKIYLYVFLILIIVIALIWYFGFYRFSSSEAPELKINQEEEEEGNNLPDIGEIDESLLEDGQELPEFSKENIGPVGRDNPFMPFKSSAEEKIQLP